MIQVAYIVFAEAFSIRLGLSVRVYFFSNVLVKWVLKRWPVSGCCSGLFCSDRKIDLNQRVGGIWRGVDFE